VRVTDDPGEFGFENLVQNGNDFLGIELGHGITISWEGGQRLRPCAQAAENRSLVHSAGARRSATA
jgi:hypothetical protein